MIILAERLRHPEELENVPNDQPGWYRWWAPEKALRQLLGREFGAIQPELTRGQGPLSDLFFIYVGMTTRRTIRARLNEHVNQEHTFTNIKRGFLSTLRQSISSLVGTDQGDEAATNQLIYQLTIEYFPVDMPIRSSETKNQLEQIETTEMTQNALPLNIKHNHHPSISEFKKLLLAARRAAKQRYLSCTQS